jgi:hypothetical protein
MTVQPQDYFRWAGLWTGKAELPPHEGVKQALPVRMNIKPALITAALQIDFELYDAGHKALMQATRIMLINGGSGNTCGVGYSTRRGTYLLTCLPDDDGVLAMQGPSSTGMQISITIVEESPNELLLSSTSKDPSKGDSALSSPRAIARVRRCLVKTGDSKSSTSSRRKPRAG